MLYGGGGFRVEGQVWCALTQWVKCVCVCCEGRTSSTTRHKVKWNFCAEWCYWVYFWERVSDMVRKTEVQRQGRTEAGKMFV